MPDYRSISGSDPTPADAVFSGSRAGANSARHIYRSVRSEDDSVFPATDVLHSFPRRSLMRAIMDRALAASRTFQGR